MQTRALQYLVQNQFAADIPGPADWLELQYKKIRTLLSQKYPHFLEGELCKNPGSTGAD